MKRVVPIRHVGTYGLVDTVIRLRKNVEGCLRPQPVQPLLDNAPSFNGIVVVVGIAMIRCHEEDQLEIIRTRGLDDLQYGVERRLIECRPIWLADLGTPDIGRKTFERRLSVAPGRTIQMAARSDLESRPATESIVNERRRRIPKSVGAGKQGDHIFGELRPGSGSKTRW